MFFSVIIPAYNRASLIGAALQSVIAQSFGDWECIVVDDGSTDNTVAGVESIAVSEPRIRLLKQANGGPGAARNVGAAAAQGKYLAFLDSDDVWMPWTLETYKQALTQTHMPEYLAASIQTFFNAAELELIKPQALKFEHYKDAIEAGVKGKSSPGAGMSVVLAEAFRRVGGFCTDRLNGEDHDLVLRLGECKGFTVVRTPVAVACRQHGIQETACAKQAIAGILRLIACEKQGAYAGGAMRAKERRKILTAHARPACLAHQSWKIYFSVFGWHLAQMRWRFLLGFPWRYALHVCTGWAHG